MKKSNQKKELKLDALLGQAQQMVAARRFDEAEAVCRKILEIDKGHKGAIVLLAQAAFVRGRPTESVLLLQKAIDLDPGDAQLYANLGQVLSRLGQSNDAIRAYQHAAALKPDFIDALIAAGSLLIMLGRHHEAVAVNQQALQIRDDYAPVYYNLGIAQAACGNTGEALDNYEHAVSLKPDYDKAFFNLAHLKRSLGDVGGALEGYRQAARLVPEQKLYWQQFAHCLRALDPDDIDQELEADILRCLNIGGIDHRGLVKPVLALTARKCLPKSLPNADRSARRHSLTEAVRENSLASLYQYQPLCLILERALLNDCDFERFLTDLRFAFVQAWVAQDIGEDVSEDAVRFLAALGQQCFLNEYVYFEDSEERKSVGILRSGIEEALRAGDSVADGAIALLGCYEALGSIFQERTPAILAGRDRQGVLSRLVELQVSEPKQEQQLAADIATLTDMESFRTDPVWQQYEENPYPRWISLPFTVPRPASDVFGQLFPHLLRDGTQFPSSFKILVTGCGTGRHALMTAMRFIGGSVTAIDFSRASLAFAARKAQALGIRNIEFAQADLLQVDNILGQFDIIEAVGILHHLPDPMEGWRRLCDHLRPGGFMKIGLYSDLGRQSVRAAQELAAQWGLGATADDIRVFRQRIMELDDTVAAHQLTRFSDFYTLSGCRDLAFHAREQWFTLPQIENDLRELGLTFVGFELEEQAYLRDYKARFPLDPDATSLEYWHQYELQHPEAFASLYQFWVQRPQ